MGKRKMHQNFNRPIHLWSCDQTGMPMPTPICTMPKWHKTVPTEEEDEAAEEEDEVAPEYFFTLDRDTSCLASSEKDRLTKSGSFCNWEMVMLHAYLQYQNGIHSCDTLARVRAFVAERTGIDMDMTEEISKMICPSLLNHFKNGSLDFEEYQDLCEKVFALDEVRVVVIPCKEGDAVYEKDVAMTGFAEAIEEDIRERARTRGEAFGENSQMRAMEVEGRVRLSKERGITAHYLGDTRLVGDDKLSKNRVKPGFKLPPKNRFASQHLKSTVYGDCYLFLHSKEDSLRYGPNGRMRPINYSVGQYEAVFVRPKKKAFEPTETVFSTETFAKARVAMKGAASALEASLSSSAQKPGAVAKLAKATPLSGRELARKHRPPQLSAKELAEQCAAEVEKPRWASQQPPPVHRQKASRP